MRLPRITSDNRRWWILATMTGSLSMIMIDQTVVSVALPTMQRDLGLSQSGVQWVVNAYLLLLAMLVALGGRAGDLFGSQRMFRLGVAVFVGFVSSFITAWNAAHTNILDSLRSSG